MGIFWNLYEIVSLSPLTVTVKLNEIVSLSPFSTITIAIGMPFPVSYSYVVVRSKLGLVYYTVFFPSLHAESPHIVTIIGLFYFIEYLTFVQLDPLFFGPIYR